MRSQQQQYAANGIVYPIHEAPVLPIGSSPSVTTSNAASQAQVNSQSQPTPSPLMAAPNLLSPKSRAEKAQREASLRTSWTAPGSKLNPIQCESPGQQAPGPVHITQKKSKSQIEVLKEAYFTSVSPNKKPLATTTVSGANKMVPAAPVLPANLLHGKALPNGPKTHETRFTDPTHSAQTDNDRVMALQKYNGTSTNPVKLQPKSAKNLTGNDHSVLTKIDTSFDWNPNSDLPNFLSGFDRVSRRKHTFDETEPNNTSEPASNNATGDLHQSAQFSPAYHTSQSFDDFHRYLGKGLSPPPATGPGPKFPDLHHSFSRIGRNATTAGPGIPSIESSDRTSPSNLRMRPRNQQSTALQSSNGTGSSTPSIRMAEKSEDEILLGEAYAEAFETSGSSIQQGLLPPTSGSSGRQGLLPPPSVQGKNNANGLNRYSLLPKQPSAVSSQHPASNSKKTDQHRGFSSNQNQQQQQQQQVVNPVGTSDFPVEGMMFEDFGTLESFSCIPAANSSGGCGMVSDPSSDDCKSSEDLSAGCGGGGMSDESIGTQSEGSSQGKKKNAIFFVSGQQPPQSNWRKRKSSFEL